MLFLLYVVTEIFLQCWVDSGSSVVSHSADQSRVNRRMNIRLQLYHAQKQNVSHWRLRKKNVKVVKPEGGSPRLKESWVLQMLKSERIHVSLYDMTGQNMALFPTTDRYIKSDLAKVLPHTWQYIGWKLSGWSQTGSCGMRYFAWQPTIDAKGFQSKLFNSSERVSLTVIIVFKHPMLCPIAMAAWWGNHSHLRVCDVTLMGRGVFPKWFRPSWGHRGCVLQAPGEVFYPLPFSLKFLTFCR